MQITLVRNATLVVEFGGVTFLIDPMLDDVGVRPAVPNTPNPQPSPLVPVPEHTWPLIDGAEFLMLTHLHQDHFDEAAKARIRKDIPVLCLPEQRSTVESFGFSNVSGVEHTHTLGDSTITRTAGQHGTGDIGKAMAPVCGFVFHHTDEPTLYVAGDTIWCAEVAMAITSHRPQVIVVNGGAGQFLQGDPITMTHTDVAEVVQAAPDATIGVVHLDAISHCIETRVQLTDALQRLNLRDRVLIPADGATFVTTS